MRCSLLKHKSRASANLFKYHLKPIINSCHLRFYSTLHTSAEKFINPVLSLIETCSNSTNLKKIHNHLLVHGQAQNILVQTKLLTCYGLSFKDIRNARNMFDEIPNPDMYSYKAMLKCYVTNDSHTEAILFHKHTRNITSGYDNVGISLVLKACINLFELNEGRKMHCNVTKVGNPDVFLLNTFIDMYAKCGDLDSGLRLFNEIADKNVVSWTSVITGCNQNRQAKDALNLFNRLMLSSVEPNELTMGCLLTSCAMLELLHHGKWIHGFVLKRGMHMNVVATTLLDMYVKCGEIKDARCFFDELDNIDLLLWTAMIVGYTQNGYPYDALKLFVDKKWTKIVPNSVTISNVISASGKLGVLHMGMSIHVLVFKLGLEGINSVQNSLVDMYAKCCTISEAEHVFQNMTCKETVTYNAMILGYGQNALEFEALELFNQMRLDCSLCTPDAVTLVGVFTACTSLGDPFIGSPFHCYAMKYNFLANVYVSTALINLYNKLGDSISAKKVFSGSSNKNIVTWCAMMNGYSMHGNPTGCIEIFEKMQIQEMKPNHVSFTNVLTACSRAGIVDEGKNFFENMTRKHNIEPSIKHYVCMIDMFARAGKLHEALEFIEGMTVYKEDVRTWASLLNGCVLHSQLEIGEVCVKKMLEIEPEIPDYYVMMSNLYALNGQWDDVNKIRDLMKSKRLMKCGGSSYFRVNKGSLQVSCVSL